MTFFLPQSEETSLNPTARCILRSAAYPYFETTQLLINKHASLLSFLKNFYDYLERSKLPFNYWLQMTQPITTFFIFFLFK